MPWPGRVDYREAIQDTNSAFKGFMDLSKSTVVVNDKGLPWLESGSSACVFKLIKSNQGPTVAVRCFLRKVEDQFERYTMLKDYLKDRQIPFLVFFSYIPDCVIVNGARYPIIEMEWASGECLDVFIKNNLNNPDLLTKLAQKWRKLVADIQKIDIAHGDLQHGNVIADDHGNLRLVDYDCMFIPEFIGRPSPEIGHPNYNHPLKSTEHYNKDIDNFAALVIYLSIKALSENAELWKIYNIDDNLILSQDDYVKVINSDHSKCFEILAKSTDPEVVKLTEILKQCCSSNNTYVPSLEEILRQIQETPNKRQRSVISDNYQDSGNRPKYIIGLSPDKKKCKHCGKEIRPAASFCGNCGETIRSNVQFCGNCGEVRRPNARFCGNCGAIRVNAP